MGVDSKGEYSKGVDSKGVDSKGELQFALTAFWKQERMMNKNKNVRYFSHFYYFCMK